MWDFIRLLLEIDIQLFVVSSIHFFLQFIVVLVFFIYSMLLLASLISLFFSLLLLLSFFFFLFFFFLLLLLLYSLQAIQSASTDVFFHCRLNDSKSPRTYRTVRILTDFSCVVVSMNRILKKKVRLVTVVEDDPKAPFSIAITPRYRGGRYSFSWIAPLYP